MVTFQTFKETIRLFEENNIKYWIFGGWALDGVRQKISREHGDIDMYISEDEILKLRNVLASKNLELKQREQMYFVDSENLQLGVVIVTDEGNEIVAHGNKTIAHYPKEVFKNVVTGVIEDITFNSVPKEILALEAGFSKYEGDSLLGTQLEVNKELFGQIKIEKIRDSRS